MPSSIFILIQIIIHTARLIQDEQNVHHRAGGRGGTLSIAGDGQGQVVGAIVIEDGLLLGVHQVRGDGGVDIIKCDIAVLTGHGDGVIARITAHAAAQGHIGEAGTQVVRDLLHHILAVDVALDVEAGEHRRLACLEGEPPVSIGRASRDRVVGVAAHPVGGAVDGVGRTANGSDDVSLIQGKGVVLIGGGVLVGGLGDGQVTAGHHGQVELDLAVGVHRAPLQVEEGEGVVGVVLQIPVAAALLQVSVDPVLVAGLGGVERIADVHDAGLVVLQIAIIIIDLIHSSSAGREIDLASVAVVDAAHVQNQNAVDVNPHVVVTGEGENHILVVNLAILGHHEGGLDLHAEMVVGTVFVGSEHIKRQEIGATGCAAGGTGITFGIDGELRRICTIAVGIQGGEIPATIVTVIAGRFIIEEQAIQILITAHFVRSGTAKQVCQAVFALSLYSTSALGSQHRIPVDQFRFDNALGHACARSGPGIIPLTLVIIIFIFIVDIICNAAGEHELICHIFPSTLCIFSPPTAIDIIRVIIQADADLVGGIGNISGNNGSHRHCHIAGSLHDLLALLKILCHILVFVFLGGFCLRLGLSLPGHLCPRLGFGLLG